MRNFSCSIQLPSVQLSWDSFKGRSRLFQQKVKEGEWHVAKTTVCLYGTAEYWGKEICTFIFWWAWRAGKKFYSNLTSYEVSEIKSRRFALVCRNINVCNKYSIFYTWLGNKVRFINRVYTLFLCENVCNLLENRLFAFQVLKRKASAYKLLDFLRNYYFLTFSHKNNMYSRL